MDQRISNSNCDKFPYLRGYNALDDSDNNGTNGGEEVQLMTLILVTVAPAVLITTITVFLVQKRFKSKGIT